MAPRRTNEPLSCGIPASRQWVEIPTADPRPRPVLATLSSRPGRLSLGTCDFLPEREPRCGRSIADADLGENIRKMPRYRLIADVQRRGDFPVGLARCDQ